MDDSDKKPDPEVEEYIDQNLKRVFSHLEQEEVPDRFKDLLSRLRAKEQEPPSEK